MSSSDRIEKVLLLKAPRARVWRAITDIKEFGKWLNVQLEAPFEPGKPAVGRVTLKEYEHVRWEMTVERMDAERLFSFKWHPFAVDQGVDYSGEEPTLVEFLLEDAPGGTKLTVVESGFDRVPVARRAKAFQMNEMGWGMVVKSIEKSLDSAT
jgi:uncharacterized protein YndB with AHSA1/START domain